MVLRPNVQRQNVRKQIVQGQIVRGSKRQEGQDVHGNKTYVETKCLGGQNVHGRKDPWGQNVWRDKMSGDITSFVIFFQCSFYVFLVLFS
jgi:hypothetical protein